MEAEESAGGKVEEWEEGIDNRWPLFLMTENTRCVCNPGKVLGGAPSRAAL